MRATEISELAGKRPQSDIDINKNSSLVTKTYENIKNGKREAAERHR